MPWYSMVVSGRAAVGVSSDEGQVAKAGVADADARNTSLSPNLQECLCQPAHVARCDLVRSINRCLPPSVPRSSRRLGCRRCRDRDLQKPCFSRTRTAERGRCWLATMEKLKKRLRFICRLLTVSSLSHVGGLVQIQSVNFGAACVFKRRCRVVGCGRFIVSV